MLLRPMLGEPLDHHVLADPVDLIEHVGFDLPRRRTQGLDTAAVSLLAHVSADRGPELAQQCAQPVEIVSVEVGGSVDGRHAHPA